MGKGHLQHGTNTRLSGVHLLAVHLTSINALESRFVSSFADLSEMESKANESKTTRDLGRTFPLKTHILPLLRPLSQDLRLWIESVIWFNETICTIGASLKLCLALRSSIWPPTRRQLPADKFTASSSHLSSQSDASVLSQRLSHMGFFCFTCEYDSSKQVIIVYILFSLVNTASVSPATVLTLS